MAVRDSKLGFEEEQGVLLVQARAWADFLGLVRR
ncbi:DUF397 domain-containing protein [Streptomyces sp. NPDC060334]